MSRKRDKPYFSRHAPYNFPKRRRPPPHFPSAAVDEDDYFPENSAKTNTAVVVTGLSTDYSVLDLKSRFQIYGPVSRTRMDSGGVAYVTFRSKDSAESAIAASLDPSFGITLDSTRVKVTWANDPVPQWREGVKNKEASSSSSKLLRPELPLSRHGRVNRLGSTIVNLREVKNGDGDGDDGNASNNNGNNKSRTGLDVPFKGREIIAYDDIL